ncbi:MAG: HisA/HisF-related TIM barrel protein, partial [Candidatus Hodgkinia cicadicola]
VATRGWANISKVHFDKLNGFLSETGATCLLWTNVNRDGTLAGLDFRMIDYVIKACPIPVVISGGVANVCDLIALQNNYSDSIAGVVCGKAIYERTLSVNIANQIFDVPIE